MTDSMFGLFKRIGSTRVARGGAAMIYGQMMQVFIQLASVPILVGAWGLTGYGQWLVVFTLPGLLAVGDIGLSAATGNAMIIASAQGDQGRVAKLFADLRAVLGTICLLIVLLSISIVFLFGNLFELTDLPGGHIDAVFVALIIYASLGIFSSGIMAAYRAADKFASSNFQLQNIALAESATALFIAWRGGEALLVAMSYVLVRLAGTAFLLARLYSVAAWLRIPTRRIDWSQMRPLLGPALSTLPLPAAYAITMQGAVLAIGWSVGSGAIPAFVVTRTLTRAALQICNSISFASMPQFTAASARNETQRQDQIVLLNLTISAIILIPMSIFTAIYGKYIIAIWTNNHVAVDSRLLYILLMSMLCSGVWMPIGNLILAINRQALYTWFFLASALVGTMAGALAALQMGSVGAALGILAVDIAMVFWVFRKAQSVHIVDARRLGHEVNSQINSLIMFMKRFSR